MTISHALAHTIIAYTKEGLSEEQSIDKVFAFMDANGIAGFKPAVLRYVRNIIATTREDVSVRLYSPFPLSTEEKTNILAQFPSDCVVEEVVDPSLIGGYRVEHSYTYMDATTAHVVDRLKQHLLHS